MEKRTFINIYRAAKEAPTPAQKFVSDISKLTGRCEQTVYAWLSGKVRPKLEVMLLLERHFNIPFQELFPLKPESDDKQ